MHSPPAQLPCFSFFLTSRYLPAVAVQPSSEPVLSLVWREVAFLALVGVASHKAQEAGPGKGAHLQ